MFRVSVGEYEVCCQAGGLPEMLSEYQQHAALSEDFGVVDESGSSICFVSVGRVQQWPSLVVIQRYAPAGCGFVPGVLVIPETHRLFIGAGRRLLGYDLSKPARLLEREADFGFWAWSRHGSVVLMAAELELAAWDVAGRKLWSRFVEPPWQYEVMGDTVALDVMGGHSHIQLASGKPAKSGYPHDTGRVTG
jgi:hypothetical protein